MKIVFLIVVYYFIIKIDIVLLQRQCSGTDERSGQGQGNLECNFSTKASPNNSKQAIITTSQLSTTLQPLSGRINDTTITAATDFGKQNIPPRSHKNTETSQNSQSSSADDGRLDASNSSFFRRLISTLPSCKPKTLPDKLGSMLNEIVDTTPDCNPMSTPEQIAAKVMNSLGETWIIVAVVVAFLIILLCRERTYESYLHMWQLLFMFIVHMLTLFFAMRTDLYITCHVVSFILQYGYICHFCLLLLEIVQAHAFKTNMINRGNFITYDDTHLFFLVSPLLPTIVTACFTWEEMISIYTCWLNYDNDLALGITMILVTGCSALTFVMIEDANVRFYKPLPLTNKSQRFIARINTGTLWLRTILHLLSWSFTSFAIYVQRFALFPTAFAVNVSLGVVILVSYIGGSMKSWNAVSRAKRVVQRKSIASVRVFEL